MTMSFPSTDTVSLRDGLMLMRASARTRVTFVPAKVTKTIRSGTPSFGFPAFLDKAGAKRTRSFAAQTPFCFLRLCLRYLVASSRSGRAFLINPVGACTAGEFFAERARRLQMSLNRVGLFPF